jgi:hypothetical protein|tara:strand:+ start:3467 stop:3661 length:195 start_codon:yes stop_codon:yes gene_type:complete
MVVSDETDPNGSMRAEMFARLDTHLAKSKREVRAVSFRDRPGDVKRNRANSILGTCRISIPQRD